MCDCINKCTIYVTRNWMVLLVYVFGIVYGVCNLQIILSCLIFGFLVVVCMCRISMFISVFVSETCVKSTHKYWISRTNKRFRALPKLYD